MVNANIPLNLLKKYPQLKQINEAVEVFKRTGKQIVKCPNCNNVIQVRESTAKGYLEVNCACGRNRFRMRWDPDQV